MRCLAVHRNRESADTFAFRLDRAFFAHCRLEYKSTLNPLSKGTDIPARRTTADLLIRVNEHNGFDRQRQIELANCLQRENDLCQAALHVEYARTTNDVAVDGERPVRDRSQRPDCVVVPKEQLRAQFLRSVLATRIDMFVRAVGHGGADHEVDRGQRLLENRPDQAVRAWMRGRRLGIHHVLQ
jgi:hypothetical protein